MPQGRASRRGIRVSRGQALLWRGYDGRPCRRLSINKPAELKLETVPLWIHGKPVAPSGRHGEVFNPATGQVTKRVPFADAAIVDSTVQAAAAAFPEWRDTPPLRRARVMQTFLQLLQARQKELARL